MVTARKKLIKNTIWSFLGQSSTVIIGLITNIILARLLSPFEFGQVGIIMFFIQIINVLTDGGLGGALVRLEKISDEDYSTVFIFNLAISVLLFLLLIASSGTIASYYNDVKLKSLICVSSIIIVINAFNIVQSARIVRDMKFKTNLGINVVSVILSSSIGIYMATKGYGVWSLVIMNLILVLSKTVLLWFSEGGIGKFGFNKKAFKSLYRYGIFVTLISFFNNAFDNIYQLLLGKYFSIKQVGYFYQAKKMQGAPFFILNSLSLGVLYSHLTKSQSDKELFQKEYLKILSVFSIITAALASMIFLLAKDLVEIVLGHVWIESVIYVKLLTIASFFLLLKIYGQNICKVFDRTEKIFIWELIAILLQIITVIIGILTKSIFITLCGAIVSNLVAYLIVSFYSWRLFGLKSENEILVVAKIVGASAIGVLAAAQIDSIQIKPFLHIILIPIVFSSLFCVLLKMFGILDFKYIFSLYKGA